MNAALADRTIAVPETRELDVLAQMLERHGAQVLRCPLVAIRDLPDASEAVAWLQRFTHDPPHVAVSDGKLSSDVVFTDWYGNIELAANARIHNYHPAEWR